MKVQRWQGERLEPWVVKLGGLNYSEEAIQTYLDDPRTKSHLLLADQGVLVPEYFEEGSALLARKIFSLPFAEVIGDYKGKKEVFNALLEYFFRVEMPDFVSTRVLSQNLSWIHTLLAYRFYPVEVLIHTFYEISSTAVISDMMTSDVTPLKSADIAEAMTLLKERGLKSHIHLDPNLPPELGDLVTFHTLNSYVDKVNAVVAKRRGEMAGFLIVSPRKVPLAGYGKIIEVVMGTVSPKISDAWNVMRDMLGVLYNHLPPGYELFEIRIPAYALGDVHLFFQGRPWKVETSIVFHWLKEVSAKAI